MVRITANFFFKLLGLLYVFLREKERKIQIQCIFCDGTRRNTVPDFFLRRSQPGTAFRNLFPLENNTVKPVGYLFPFASGLRSNEFTAPCGKTSAPVLNSELQRICITLFRLCV
jgi:hypothetical protein